MSRRPAVHHSSFESLTNLFSFSNYFLYLSIGCGFGIGSYSIYYDGLIIQSGGSFNNSDTVAFGSCTAASSQPTIPECDPGYIVFELDLKTDSFGNEVFWELIDTCSNEMAAFGGPYGPNTQYLQALCVEEGREYVFNITDTAEDGICTYLAT